MELCKREIVKYRGLKEDTFPYYLKEFEFRYNNIRNDLFEELIKAIKVE